MEFHPDKCEVITISRKRNPVQYPYTLNGHQLKHIRYQVGLPWCPDNHDFRWDKHIDYITSKANSTLGFLRRNINISNSYSKNVVI